MEADANYVAIVQTAAERAETASRRGRCGAESRREKCQAHPRRWGALRAASIESQHGNTNGETRRSRLCFRADSRSMCRTQAAGTHRRRNGGQPLRIFATQRSLRETSQRTPPDLRSISDAG